MPTVRTLRSGDSAIALTVVVLCALMIWATTQSLPVANLDPEAKYYAIALMMAVRMVRGSDRNYFRQLALERLIRAVCVEEQLRRCRDLDVEAATRLRSQW